MRWQCPAMLLLDSSSQLQLLLSAVIGWQCALDSLRTPGIPPFCIDVLMKLFASKNLVILSAFSPKKSFPSTFKRDITLNLSIVSAPSSLGIRIQSASCQALLIAFFFHKSRRQYHNCLATAGHLLYIRYGTPLGPGAEDDLVFLSLLANSLQVGGWSLKLTVGAGNSCNPSIIVLDSESGLLWASSKCFSTSC